MNDDEYNDYFGRRFRATLFGFAVFIAITVGAAVLAAAGASNVIIAAFVVLSMFGLIIIGVRR